MKTARLLALGVAMLASLHCQGAPAAPKEYVHSVAGFKITAPAGWNKTNEDNEMYEFRKGDNRLIEVGGFDLEIDPTEIAEFTTDQMNELLEVSTTGGLEGYCEEADIVSYTVRDEGLTTWGGKDCYRIQARGHSNALNAAVIVDIMSIILKDRARVYMFASQIAESEYQGVSPALETMIASFALLP